VCHKIALQVGDAIWARAIATVLEDVVVPSPDAVTWFQSGTLWRVEAYYAEPPEPSEVAAGLSAVLPIALPLIELVEVPDDNWVGISQAALPPVKAGRFTVHGSHDRAQIPQGPLAIEIDAGEAFGTAHHATTLGCLMTIDRLARRRRFQRILDLGCGSAVLAIAAARAWPSAVVAASDIDPEAVRVAQGNVARNGVRRIRAVCADGLPRGPRTGAGRYDLLIANILAAPLITLAPKLARAVEPGGMLVLSGLLTSQAPEVRAAYRAQGVIVVSELLIAGWSTLLLCRRHPRPIAPRQPAAKRPN
jgi:ribosomal protein L11 methyltransferase